MLGETFDEYSIDRGKLSVINERTNEIHISWFMLCAGVTFQLALVCARNMLHEYNYLNLYQKNISKTMQSAAKTIILINMLLL